MFKVFISEADKSYIGVEFIVNTSEEVIVLVKVALKYGKNCKVETYEEEF